MGGCTVANKKFRPACKNFHILLIPCVYRENLVAKGKLIELHILTKIRVSSLRYYVQIYLFILLLQECRALREQ